MLKKAQYVLLAALAVWSCQFLPAQAAQHSLGSNVITPQGTVFTITTENNQTVRRPYTSSGAFLSYSFNTWDSIVGASAEDMALPVGSFIPPQDGKIICSDRGSDKGTCYLITNGQKAGFTSADVFKKLGYTFNHIMSGDVSFLPSTNNIDTSTAPHNPGTLINKDGTVYLVGTNRIYGIPDLATLQSWGYTTADIVTANSADRNLPYIGMLPSRQPQYLQPLNDGAVNQPTTTPTVPPTPTPTPSTTTAGASMTVTIDPANPPSGTLNTGASQAAVMMFRLTNTSNQTIPVYGISTYFGGTVQPSDITNVYWYSSTGSLLGQSAPKSVSGYSGIMALITSYPNALVSLSPNSSQSIVVKVDVSASAVAGRTLTAQLVSKDYLDTESFHTTINGIPISGNLMTIGGTSTTTQARIGQLVKANDGTVYLVGNGGLIGFPTIAIFNSWGFCFTDVVAENSAEASLSVVGNMPTKGTTPLPSYIPSTLPAANCPVATPTLSITSPNGGEKYLKGSQQSIQWTSSNVNQVNIQLYKAGAFYSNITSSGYPVNNGNYYSWSIPSSLPDGTDYQIRISDANSSTFAQSSGNFSILSPSQADTLSVTISPINPVAGQVTRGQTGVAVLAADLTNTSQQTMSVSQVTFVCQGCASTPDFSNVYLWSATQGQLASMQSTSANNGFFTFNLQTPLTITANSKQTLVVKLDIASPGSGFTNQNFYIEFRSIVASDTNGSVLIQGTPVRSNTFTIQ